MDAKKPAPRTEAADEEKEQSPPAVAGSGAADSPAAAGTSPGDVDALDIIFAGAVSPPQAAGPSAGNRQPSSSSALPAGKGQPATEANVPPPKPAAPPPPPVAPAWKVLEPEDQTDPVRHEVSTCTMRDGGWTLLAASVRGKLHAHKALWRDDAFGIDTAGDWTMIALADGAGSARLARIGAQVACEEALKAVRVKLAGYRWSPPQGDVPTAEDQSQLRIILTEGAIQARAGLMRETHKRRCALRDLNTTFLLVVHTPFQDNTLVGAIQIGDGAIGVYTTDDVCSLIGTADHGQYSSETCFLTTPNIEEQFGQRVHFRLFKKGLRCLAVMCDGVADDFFPEDKRLIELFTGNPIKELKTRQGEPLWGVMHKDRGLHKDPRDGQALVDWLKYEKRGSSDDRTLVLMYRREPL